MHHRRQCSKSPVSHGQQQGMCSPAGTARRGHAGGVDVMARRHDPVGHRLRPQHLYLHRIGSHMRLAPDLSLRLAPAENGHIDRHGAHAGECSHAHLLVGTVTTAFPVSRRRNDQSAADWTMRSPPPGNHSFSRKRQPGRRIDRPADIEPRERFEGVVLRCITVVADLRP